MHNVQFKHQERPVISDTPSLDMDGVFHIIERKGGLVCKFYGCWNKENAIAFSLSFKECITKNYQFKKWGLVKDIGDWRQVSDEAVEVLEELISWAEEHGQVANAYIYEGELSFEVFSSMCAKELLSKVHYKKFNEIETGLVWLKNLGFNLINVHTLRPAL
jgi:hypothetical protein